MSVSLSVDGPGDAELISAVRGGDVDAYGELFARHVDAARRLARQLAGPADADDLVSDAFTKVLTVLQRGGGPDLAFRAYLLTAVRRLHVDKMRAGSRLKPVDDLAPFDPGLPFHDTAVEGFDNAAAARAFSSLPERWQMVLWHTEVEQQKPADIAPLLGMSANSVSALAYRAREGLRQAFLSQHATDPDDVDCAWTRDHLGAYVRGGLSRRDAARVDDHLAACRACAAVYLELTEVNSGLAGILAPLLLGTAGAGYVSSGGTGSGFLSSGFSAAKTFAAAHASVTAIGGLLVTATAVVSIYGATHFHSKDAADVGSPPVNHSPSASSGPTSGGNDKNGQHNGQSPTSGTSTLPPASQSPSVTTSSAPPSTLPTEPESTAPTDQSSEPTGPSGTTSEPTGPTTGPTGPTGPGDDDITFHSDPPKDPKFGDTYHVRASSASGKDVVFSIGGSNPDDACSLDQDTVTFDHAGTCVIKAEVTSRTGAAKEHTQRIDIPKENQDITFAAPDDAAVDGTDTLAASSSSGLQVGYTLDSTNGACRLDGTTVRYDHALDCTITASQDGNRDYLGAKSVTRSFTVAKGEQQIGFTPPKSPAVGGDDSLTATSSSGLPVAFGQGSSPNGACTVKGTTVRYLHAQDCAVTITVGGDDDYNAADVTEHFSIDKGDQTISFTPPTGAAVGGDDSLSATSSSGLPVSFGQGSSPNGACSVDGDTVTYVHAQDCAVTATQAGNDDYNAAPDTTGHISIGKGSQTISFTAPSAPAVGENDTLTATSTSGSTVTFVQGTSGNGACSVKGTTVSYLHAQDCTVSMSADGTDDYEPLQGVTRTFTIAKGTPQITFGDLDPAPRVGAGDDLSATSASDGAFTYSLGDGTTNNACTVSANGSVVFEHAGTCSVTAHQAETADYESGTATDRFGIGTGTPHLTFALPATGKVDGSDLLTATSSDSDGQISYSVGQNSQACILNDAKTRVVYQHVGACTVTATLAATDDHDGATLAQTVTVTKAAQQITFTSNPPTAPALHSTYDVSATGGKSGKRVSFSSATPDVCRVSNAENAGHGTVTLDHAGDCVINANQEGSADYDPAPQVQQTVHVPKTAQQITFTSTPPSPANVGTSYQVKATGGGSGNTVTFGAATPKTCSVDGSTVTFLAAGTCTVTADQLGNGDYDPAPRATQDVQVSLKSDLAITATELQGHWEWNGHDWHGVNVRVTGLADGATAQVTGSSSPGVVIIPFDLGGCFLPADGVCHISRTPVTTLYLVGLPRETTDADVTFKVESDDTPGAGGPVIATTHVTVHGWDDQP